MADSNGCQDFGHVSENREYNLFKKRNFDENDIFVKYNEVRPGKLYKILNSTEKKK